MAKRLNLHRATIYRELKRNQILQGQYLAEAAQSKTNQRKVNCRRKKILSDTALLNTLTTLLKDHHLSPEQIAGRFKFASHQTIYNALSTDFEHLQVYLRRYGKRRGRGRKGRRKPKKRPEWFTPISKRPMSVTRREECGHWERDTMYLKNRKMLLVCVERKSRLVRIEKLKKIEPKTVYEQSLKLMQIRGRPLRTMTNDNGAEFMGNTGAQVPIYFCNPYSPQERGSVENTIGVLRQYLTRKTSMHGLTSKKIKEIEARLNHRPRKCLGFKTPYEVMFRKVSHWQL